MAPSPMSDRRIVFKLGNPSDGITRRFDYKGGSWPSWSDLSKRIESLFHIPKEYVELSYVDEDKDEIRLRSNSELKEYYASHQGFAGTFIARFTIRDLRQDLERIEHLTVPNTPFRRMSSERNLSMRNRRPPSSSVDSSEATSESSVTTSTSASRRSRHSRSSLSSTSRPSSIHSNASSVTITPRNASSYPPTTTAALSRSNSHSLPSPTSPVIYVLTDPSSLPDNLTQELRRRASITTTLVQRSPTTLQSMHSRESLQTGSSLRSASPTTSVIVREWLEENVTGVQLDSALARQTSTSTLPPPYTVMDAGSVAQETRRRVLRRGHRGSSS